MSLHIAVWFVPQEEIPAMSCKWARRLPEGRKVRKGKPEHLTAAPVLEFNERGRGIKRRETLTFINFFNEVQSGTSAGRKPPGNYMTLPQVSHFISTFSEFCALVLDKIGCILGKGYFDWYVR